jgi:hypothetical protein
MRAVTPTPPPGHLPPAVVIVIKVSIFITVLAFAIAVLNAGVELVTAGGFVSLVVVAAAKAGTRLTDDDGDPVPLARD